MNSFEKIFSEEEYFLTEGSLLERLRREFKVEIDEHIASASVIYNTEHKKKFEAMYKSYVDIAMKEQLPILIMTSTRRADKERVEQSVYHEQDIISDNVNFLKNIREQYEERGKGIFIGGLLGCKGDAYNPEETLDVLEATKYHEWQINAFKKAGVDYLFACIMPALPEAIGMAKAMEKSGLPYIISFMIRSNGCLLDGTSIDKAIREIDLATVHKPLAYMSNCVHPKVMYEALKQEINQTQLVKERYIGIQANTSSLPPEDLNEADVLKVDGFDELMDYMKLLHKEYSFKVFGGCCGTNEKHIQAIADMLK